MERRGLPFLNHVLQHTLRGLCSETQWMYAVFWRILPRNYPPPKWESDGGAVERSKGNKRNWILVWEDGFCDFPACASGKEVQMGSPYGSHSLIHVDESAETAMVMHPELFFKMSHEVYNYGEGLMGKVAADNSHKWVSREPIEHEISFLSPWHGSLDPHPRTWEAQFKAGIQTIAVISVREGLVQLGSIKKVVEDLNFVIMMQRKFNYLQNIPGVFVPHPSSLSGTKRRDSVDSSSPTEGCSLWPGSRDETVINGVLPSTPNNPDPYDMNALMKQPYSSGVVGIKRPPDVDPPHGLTAGRESGFLPPGAITFNGSPRFDSRQGGGQPECPSPPKALITRHSLSSVSLLPSMSSLHNLLSKLPSVRALESNATVSSSSPSRLSSSSAQLHQQQPPRLPISPDSSTLSPGRGLSVLGAKDQHPSPTTAPSGHHQHMLRSEHIRPTSASPRVDHNNGGDRETSASGSSQKHSSSRSPDFIDSGNLSDQQQHCGQPLVKKSSSPATKDKLTSFLDSDQDSLTDLGLNDDLENSETYNSFLKEII